MADRRLTSRRRAGATPAVCVGLASLLILGGGVLCGCGSGRSRVGGVCVARGARLPGAPDRTRDRVSSARAWSGDRRVPFAAGAQDRGARRGVRREPRGACRVRDRHAAAAHVLGRSDLDGAVLRRSGDARADGRCPGATRRARTGLGSVPLVGSAAVEQAARPVRGREGPTGGGLRRRSTLARLARGRAVGVHILRSFSRWGRTFPRTARTPSHRGHDRGA